MTKQEKASEVQRYYERVKRLYSKEIETAINNTTIYGPEPINRKRSESGSEHKIFLVPQDSVTCGSSAHEGRVCLLNFASYKNPGGRFLDGSLAQEEALCHESILYPVLLAFDNSYYAWNRKHLNQALYLDRALYSKDVLFEKDGKKIFMDVLTCAAPNYRAAKRYQSVALAENREVFKQRIKFMYDIAEEQGVNTLVAGAWGCGVFMQPPEMTCRLFVEVLRDGCYKHLETVYFAIPDENSRNFKEFSHCI